MNISFKSFRAPGNCIDYAEEKEFAKALARALEERLAEIREKGEVEGFEEGFVEGFKEGFEKGFKEGRELANIEIARNCKSLGIPIETIAKITGLTMDEIQAL